MPMSKQVIQISEAIYTAIKEHALAAVPNECCGLLGGKKNFITTSYALRNTAATPETRYAAAPADLFAAMRQIREVKQDLLGIYHSHPRTAAYPSPTDVELAFYPEAIYFIISLQSEIDLRGFKINGSEIHEVEILIVKNL